jgi:hypothetical protein
VAADYGKGVPCACACEEDPLKLWDAGKNKVVGSNKHGVSSRVGISWIGAFVDDLSKVGAFHIPADIIG